MKNNTKLPRRALGSVFGHWRSCFAIMALLTFSVAGYAQETTSSIRGTVNAPDGSPAAGAMITLTDTRTATRRSLTTNSSGVFSATGLRVGGPYEASISTPNFADQTVTDIYLTLGDTHTFTVNLSPAQIEEIVVTAAQIGAVQVALGPSATFDFDDLQNLPAINRDIRDIIRIDPRVYIDEAFVGAIQCVGANPRFNSLTVDGVRLNDNFGLNANGYPTQGMPFPFDAVQNVAVEMSPFDVQYGGFTACNINAVTRSGTNEFHGGVFIDYTDDSLSGDSLEGDSIDQGSFDKKRYGFNIGGPILRDKLFFFAAYEFAESADTFDRCAGDQSCGRPVEGVSQAQLTRIRNIADTLYQYDVGDDLFNAPNEDEKYLIRLDWNITEDHQAALTYNYNDGSNTSQGDNDSDEYEFSNHFYERGAELKSTAFQLHSNWTENFSTDFRYSDTELDNRQISNDTAGFAEVQIRTYFNGERATVYMGRDDSRQANDLDWDSNHFKLAANYTLGDHFITGGYEREEVNVFNQFVQHVIGQYNFDESNTNFNGDPVGCNSSRPDGCIDQFEDFSPDDIYYDNAAGSLDPRDAAATFGYQVDTVYIQDQWSLPEYDLSFAFGLRYDQYSSDDLPKENANFVARNGFSNSRNFDGESLLQPRFGFNWDISDRISLHGGAGLYGGGNPNVWLANNYQNDGQTLVRSREGDGGLRNLNKDPSRNLTTEPLGLDGMGRPMYDAPQTMQEFVRDNPGNSAVNSVGPNFKIPSNWKYSLGGRWMFDIGNSLDYMFSADLIYSHSENSATLVDNTLVQVGTAPGNIPIYYPSDKSIPGCATDPLSNPIGCSRLFNNDYILGNVQGADAEQFSLSLTLQKEHDSGFDWLVGYAFTEANDVNPMTSSTAGSNYFNVALVDGNNPGRARSNYEIPHRFIVRLGYRKAFFGDYDTRFTVVASRNQGRPFSYTFDGQEMFIRGPFFNPDDDRTLLYMPTGPNDPNVVFDAGFDQDAFFAFANSRDLTRYGGGVVPRNVSYSDWWGKMDLRISQEIPGFGDQRASVALIIRNLGNLINDEWGVLYEQSFPRMQSIVDASLLDMGTPNDFSDDVYQYNEFFNRDTSRRSEASLWSVLFQLIYSF